MEVVTETDEWLALEGEWNDLVDHSSGQSVFMRHEWLTAWWECFSRGRALRVLLVRGDGGELVGAAAFYITRVRLAGVRPIRCLQFVGSHSEACSDYLDILYREGCAEAVLAAVLEHLAGNRRAHPLLDLSDIASESPTLEALPRLAEGRGMIVERSEACVCPRLSLPDRWDAYLASLSKKRRFNVRYYTRQCLDKAPGVVSYHRDPADVLAALDDIVRLHREMWQARKIPGHFADAPMVAFHRRAAEKMARKGLVAVVTLGLDGKCIGGVYGFVYGDAFYYYNSGFDPERAQLSLGTVMVGLAIRDAIERGKKYFDFLRGESDYKYAWTDQRNLTMNLRVGYCGPVTRWLIRRAAQWQRFRRRMGRVLPAPVTRWLRRFM